MKKNYCPLNSGFSFGISDEEKKKFSKNDNNEKQKYIDNSDFRKKNISPGIFCNKNNTNSTDIDIDSFLRYAPNQYQNKTSIELKKELDHNNFGIAYSNKMKKKPIPKDFQNKKKNVAIINDKPYIGAGRGMGNIDISELIRCGQDTRRMNDQFKEKQESTIIDRFHIIDKDFQNPNNIVMDLPRGGIQTRKNKKLVDMHDKKKINFNY